MTVRFKKKEKIYLFSSFYRFPLTIAHITILIFFTSSI